MDLKLESYQQEAVEFLCSRSAAALFTSVGLGKTATVLSAFKRLRDAKVITNMLIVAPLRVAKYTWPMEVDKWDQFSDFTICNLRDEGYRKGADVYTINYESIQKLCTPKRRLPFDCVVFDEITRVKNHKSKRMKVLDPCISNAQFRWGLTGTPAANSLLALFAQIRALDGGETFGRSFFQFRQLYFDPKGYMGYNWQPKKGAQRRIEEKLQDVALVQSSETYSDVADTVVDDIDVPLPKAAADAYAELEREFLLDLGDDSVTAVSAAVLVGKLLQMTGGNVYDEEGKRHQIHDAKIVALNKLLGEPLLVGANYRHEIDRIVREIPEAEAWDEKTTLDRWNRGEIKMLVAHPASVGHGLNLQAGGRRVAWYSLPWDRENYLQFNARVARKGQDQQPVLHRLISPGTIDEAVVEALRSKGRAESSLLQAVRLLQQKAR